MTKDKIMKVIEVNNLFPRHFHLTLPQERV